MSETIQVQLELPKEWKRFRMPSALHERLQELLDRQDDEGSLTRRERREAEALVQLSDLLTLLKLRAEQALKQKK